MANTPLFQNARVQGANNVPGEYPFPFLDIASFMLPSSLKEVLDMCTVFWLKNDIYRSAAQRIVRYFITEIDFKQNESDRELLTNFLNNDFDVTKNAASIGDDLLSCGLTASSVVFPVNRFLVCPKCFSERTIDNAHWEYRNGDFLSQCSCGYQGKFKVLDRKSFDRTRVKLQRWSPYEISVQQHPLTKRTIITWDIPQDIRGKVKAGDHFIVRDLPMEILLAIKDNKCFEFDPKFVHYEAEDTIASINMQGYGLPRLMAGFAQAYYIQMLKRANEALAKDYMVPFRLISPAAMPVDSQNPWSGSVNSDLVNQTVANMVSNHRSNPTTWNFSPIPMNYNAFSGEGQMATPALLDQGIGDLLAGFGIPVDFYRGTLTLQAAPMALRTLQQSWPGLISSMNRWLNFTVDSITRYMNWETPENSKFRPVTLADDIERRQLMLQLASSNMVSKQTAFSVWGINPRDEQEQIMNEMKYEQKKQREFEEESQGEADLTGAIMAAAGGMQNPQGPAMQGAPVGGGYDVQTVSGRAQQVEETASQLVQMPYEARRTEMGNIKKTDPELHALIKVKMEELRSQVKNQATQQLSQGG